MDFAKLKVGTIITYDNEEYFAVPELPKYAISGVGHGSYSSYNARAIAYSLSTGKRLGSKRVEQAEISPNQLSIADQKVFLVKLQLLGYLSKNVEVGLGYDSIRNVTIMQDNVLVKISELGCSATFLKGVENTYNSFGKVQNKVLGRVYLKKKQFDFDLYAYIGRLDNSIDKPYVFVTLCRNESPNQYSLFASRIRNAKAWYIDTAIQQNRGKVLRMNETKFSSLLETDLQLTKQDSYWTYSLTNRNLHLVEYL